MANFFTQILYVPIYNLLMYLVAVIPGHQVAWSIIVVTIVIRLALLPSSIKASKSQLEMQKLQPELSALRSKYKGDQKKQSEEMMKLYKTHKVSPFGSCLPLIIQLVVLIIFYRVIMIGFDLDRLDLLYSFVPKPNEINLHFFGIDVSRPDLWVLPIIAGALQFVQAKMIPQPPMQKGTNDPMVMMNKQMIYFFPFVTVFIARSLPAGLAIYWVMTSLFMIFQQWYINSRFGLGFFGRFPEVPLAKLPEYTQEDEANKDGTEKASERKKLPENLKEEKIKGVALTVRRKKK
jgi:YidC/Oxa1 family membrane protein insertase